MGSIDFAQLLNGDLSTIIISKLDDPADVVRVASVSHTWRQFVIASGFSKSLCLRLFPEISNDVKAIVENNIIEPFEVETTGSVEVEKLKKNHTVYALLARGLAPSLAAGCIVEAISISSTDHYREENIHNTLEPRERVKGRLSYWSSMGESNPEVHETLTYKFVSKLCCITEINIRPFQDHFDHDFPIYSARAARFRMGHVREPQ
ncbi:F-box protein At4g00755-like isoform X2 [Papaver somniferum]|uniref:F-box protein At4g00755-like isoform X2 n=1 Tax=Papaver somniferum TaxID=3469 RepID=UPI000E6FA132|nr:F-box protein At4g00755-like isoform X2 [Papaver somniferum]